MNVLIAHADEAERRRLAGALVSRGYTVIEADSGEAALDILMAAGAPRLAVIDWEVPGLEGPEVCRLLRDFHLGHPPYIILLGAPGGDLAIPEGLRAGANDVLPGPAPTAELRERVEFGRHVVELPWGERLVDGDADVLYTRLDLRLQTT
jgi:DNA-binding response OmpR family regulator